MLQRQLAFIFVINLVALFCVSAHTHEIRDARVQALPAYAIASAADLINSTICGKELKNFRDAVDQRILWGLKVLDSSGGFKPGFFFGNTYWLGSRSQCRDTVPLQIAERVISNSALYRVSQKEFPPFEINYFVAHLRYNSTVNSHVILYNEDVITLGLCLPASCTTSELAFILERIFYDKVLLMADLYSMNFQLIQVKDLKDDNEWLSSNALLFVCTALAFSAFMLTIGTVYDIFVHQKHVKGNATNETNGNVEHVSKDVKTELSLHRENKIGQILICFSVYTNTKEIFSTKVDAGTISVFHCVRFIGMCLIIIAHTISFTMDSVDNKIWMRRQTKNYSNLIFSFGTVSIDIYFFLSGCLMTYLYLRNKMNKGQIESTDCKEKLIELFVHIIKRFIRLTPAYMMVIGILQLTSAWLDKTSQFYIEEKAHETCAKYWWRNLLYINNFFGIDTMCMSWGWYMGNDMQFYVIGMTLLILSTTYFYTAATILIALLICSIIFSGYTAYVYELVLSVTFNERTKEQMVLLYILPWYRISPHIIGIITGYILAKAKKDLILQRAKYYSYFYVRATRFTRKIIILCWGLSSVCYVLVLFALNERTSTLAAALYVALHKIFWIIPIAWLVIVSFIKPGGIVNQFLSFKCWIPLSKMTYCAYLLHPVIIRTVCLHSETSTHLESLPINMIFASVGYIVISYVCSYILSVMVEIPCISLMRIFIQYRATEKCKMLDRKVS